MESFSCKKVNAEKGDQGMIRELKKNEYKSIIGLMKRIYPENNNSLGD